VQLTGQENILLLCGIANYSELKTYLQANAANVYVRDFKDHHRYDRYDLESIRTTYSEIGANRKIMVTTEKDAARLLEHRNWFLENKIEIFVLPIFVQFLFNDAEKFNADIQHYIGVAKQKSQF